jgi:hypothetical protein
MADDGWTVDTYTDCSPGSPASLNRRLRYQNRRRSERAGEMIEHYSRDDTRPIDRMDEIVNILVDMRHYCREHKIEIEKCFDHAFEIYRSEVCRG